MANSTVYVSEYANTPVSLNASGLAVAQEPALAEQQITVSSTASSAASSAFNNQTHLIRVSNDGANPISILVGGSSVALTGNTSKRLAANQTEYFWVTPGNKLAAIIVT